MVALAVEVEADESVCWSVGVTITSGVCVTEVENEGSVVASEV